MTLSSNCEDFHFLLFAPDKNIKCLPCTCGAPQGYNPPNSGRACCLADPVGGGPKTSRLKGFYFDPQWLTTSRSNTEPAKAKKMCHKN
eukprot:1014675-Amphidinium_carterae.1